MKHWLPVLTALLLFAAGCGTSQPATKNIGNQASNNVANATSVQSNNTTGNASGNDASANMPGQGTLPSTDLMQNTATDLVQRYVASHNDKTLAAYKKDAREIFDPGFANLFLPMVSSGVDYNHPVQSSKVNVESVKAEAATVFVAMTSLQIHYKGESPKTYDYVFRFVKDNGHWYINKIT